MAGVIARVAAGNPGVFSTAFSRDKGLEPNGPSRPSDEDDDATEELLLGLEGGIDHASAGWEER